MKELVYKTSATVVGGREGRGKLKDNPTEFILGFPKELGGAGADKALNPEQLFAVAYAACYESSLNHVVRSEKLGYKPDSVEAEVLFSKREGGYTLDVNLIVNYTGVSKEKAEELNKKADMVCPYSHILRGGAAKVNISSVIK